MRIKIIKNKPIYNPFKNIGYFSDISEYIGQEFEVIKEDDKGVFVLLDGEEKIVFHDEYEVIER